MSVPCHGLLAHRQCSHAFIFYFNLVTKRISKWKNAKMEYPIRRNSTKCNFPHFESRRPHDGTGHLLICSLNKPLLVSHIPLLCLVLEIFR